MKFLCTVTILAPKEEVVALFLNSKYLHKWQVGFISKELTLGEKYQVGAQSKIKYKMGKGEMVLIETILENDLPNSLKGNYHHSSTENTMLNTFTEIDDNTTKYEAEIEYTRFTGLIVKTMKTLFPFVFKKQVQKWMDNFKRFVEVSHQL